VVKRKKCDYMFQVAGHYHNYWIKDTKGGGYHKEERWIEPYYKNKDCPHKISKTYVKKDPEEVTVNE
jgi:hypothetical protein